MLNQVNLMGRITRDPETRFIQSTNNSFTRFTIAVERDYKAQGKESPEVDFINCVAWNKTGEFIAKYFAKGSMIAVTGSIETGNYIDQRTGNRVYTTDIRVDRAYFTGEKRNTGSSPEDNMADSNGFMDIPDGIDEELPFT